MKKLPATLILIALIFAACQAQPGDKPPAEPGEPAPDQQDIDETIDENDQKVNDSVDLPQQKTDNHCPEPEDTGQMCAQVIVWALSPDGHCCQYPTPCHAPKDWETFSSEEECLDASEQDESTE